ncbi:MAG: ABC transporter ATP-binding protein [Bacteroidota bacterium]|nr:ABC transporter ATP-binding protein [Bacteroidota bacterium]
MKSAVSIQGLAKSYGTTRAVDGLDLEIEQGELFGIIGPDGAGKTTTMQILVTLIPPDKGEVLVGGHDVRTGIQAIRSLVGYMPQRFSLYPDLSVEQNIDFFAELFGVPKSEMAVRKQRLYRFSRLGPFAKRLAGKLSGGMKQKLALSCTLVHDPEILILDEPTTGVDPLSRLEFWEILHHLHRMGTTVIVTTPYIDEALSCDRVAVMHGGQSLACGTPDELVSLFPHKLYAIREPGISLHDTLVMSIRGVLRVAAFGDSLHVAAEPDTSPSQLETELSAALGRGINLEPISPSLEDVFIHLIHTKRNDGA